MRISDWSSDVCSFDLLGTNYNEIVRRPIVYDKTEGLLSAPMIQTGRGKTDGAGLCTVTFPTPYFSGIVPRIVMTPRYINSAVMRSEERRVGKECVRMCRSRVSTYQ